MLAVFTAANVAEAVRQDTDARLAATEAMMADVGPRLDGPRGRRRPPRRPLPAIETSLDHLLHLVRHPVAAAAGKVRRGLPGSRQAPVLTRGKRTGDGSGRQGDQKCHRFDLGRRRRMAARRA